YLGAPKYFSEVAERTNEPGVATGLAWTPNGGDIIFIESTRMNGQKGLTLTGSLGDVMKESAQAALSYVRTRAKELGIAPDFYDKSDLHVHVPAAALSPEATLHELRALRGAEAARGSAPDLGGAANHGAKPNGLLVSVARAFPRHSGPEPRSARRTQASGNGRVVRAATTRYRRD